MNAYEIAKAALELQPYERKQLAALLIASDLGNIARLELTDAMSTHLSQNPDTSVAGNAHD